ncbi:MAG: glycosyltransferase [Anaerolineaceae bacterium]|nr:MAG: glycosyltransferase [Anaerolineaceae bacterium]
MIDVSVIMPVYNAEKYLPIAMDSLSVQTLNNIEIICVNDGSTDGSADILEKYANKDSRIKVFYQRNSYAGVARNTGMVVAKGKYLSFLDADDYFKPEMLMEAYMNAEKTQADIVIFGGEYFEEDTDRAYHNSGLLKEELIPYNAEYLESDKFDSLFHFTTTCPWNKLYRRSFIEKNKLRFQTYKRVNDAYFVVVAFALSNRIGFVRKDLISYRTGNSNSLQGTNAESPFQFVDVLRDIKNALNNYNLYNQNEKTFRNLCLSNCIYNLESLKEDIAFERLYNELKNNIFYDFNIIGTKKEDYYNKYAYEQFQYIISHSSYDYRQNKIYGVSKSNRFKEYLFPFEMIDRGSRIVLYAAGNVGNKFYSQIRKTNYCNIIAWVDKNVKKVGDMHIHAPEVIDMINCDYIVIAVENKLVAEKIKRVLIEDFFVEPNNIVWRDPVVQTRE